MDDELRKQGWANITIPKKLWVKLKPLAREMRKNPTPAEKRLWAYVRRNQLDGFKFRRQQVIWRFIVDFYCPRAKLVVELDGASHDDTVDYDALRTQFLESLGLRVIRFHNRDVMVNLENVLEAIQVNLHNIPADSAPKHR